MGIRRARPDAPARSLDQRHRDRREGSPLSLAGPRAAPGHTLLVHYAFQPAALLLEVRGLHERLFYRPLLAAVASLPEGGMVLSSEHAEARLAAIGFRDPAGAMRHIAALTAGVSRRAAIQRNLLPVLLGWLAQGADPDRGLLAFRRLSEDLGETHWYLRMLRDSSAAANRLTQLLSGSRFVGDLLEGIPEAVAWLESDDQLLPRTAEQLEQEIAAIVGRYADNAAAGSSALKAVRRREVLRLAIGYTVGVVAVEELGLSLSEVTDAVLAGMLRLARPAPDGIEFAIVAPLLFAIMFGIIGFGTQFATRIALT